MITCSLCIVGLGPAGRAVAAEAITQGIDTVVVDPAPDRPWRATYAAWSDEIPGTIATDVIAARCLPRAYGHREHQLEREYSIFDTARLQQSLGIEGARVVPGRACSVEAHRVRLRDRSTISADLVLDARGAPLTRDRAQQTAYGVVVPRERAEQWGGGAWLMDWRPAELSDPHAPPSFLYVVPLDDERMLIEQTCLVGRPAIDVLELRDRLMARLAKPVFWLTGDEPTEYVRFSTEPDWALRSNEVLAIGSRGGLMHPATGYSVATALQLAPVIVDAFVAGHDVCEAVWTRRARATAQLRQAGLETLLQLKSDDIRHFFDAFFALPIARQRSYLSDRSDPAATLTAMALMAQKLPPRLVGVALRQTLRELRRNQRARESLINWSRRER